MCACADWRCGCLSLLPVPASLPIVMAPRTVCHVCVPELRLCTAAAGGCGSRIDMTNVRHNTTPTCTRTCSTILAGAPAEQLCLRCPACSVQCPFHCGVWFAFCCVAGRPPVPTHAFVSCLFHCASPIPVALAGCSSAPACCVPVPPEPLLRCFLKVHRGCVAYVHRVCRSPYMLQPGACVLRMHACLCGRGARLCIHSRDTAAALFSCALWRCGMQDMCRLLLEEPAVASPWICKILQLCGEMGCCCC